MLKQTTFKSYQTEYEMIQAQIVLASVWMYCNWVLRSSYEYTVLDPLTIIEQLQDVVKRNGDENGRNLRPVIIAAQDAASERWSNIVLTAREKGGTL